MSGNNDIEQEVQTSYTMDKLKLTGRNMGRVFNSRLGRACIGHAIVHITKQPYLKLKTRPKQLLGFLPLAFAVSTYPFELYLKLWMHNPSKTWVIKNGLSKSLFNNK
jgi:hypothetical protein